MSCLAPWFISAVCWIDSVRLTLCRSGNAADFRFPAWISACLVVAELNLIRLSNHSLIHHSQLLTNWIEWYIFQIKQVRHALLRCWVWIGWCCKLLLFSFFLTSYDSIDCCLTVDWACWHVWQLDFGLIGLTFLYLFPRDCLGLCYMSLYHFDSRWEATGTLRNCRASVAAWLTNHGNSSGFSSLYFCGFGRSCSVWLPPTPHRRSDEPIAWNNSQIVGMMDGGRTARRAGGWRAVIILRNWFVSMFDQQTVMNHCA